VFLEPVLSAKAEIPLRRGHDVAFFQKNAENLLVIRDDKVAAK